MTSLAVVVEFIADYAEVGGLSPAVVVTSRGTSSATVDGVAAGVSVVSLTASDRSNAAGEVPDGVSVTASAAVVAINAMASAVDGAAFAAGAVGTMALLCVPETAAETCDLPIALPLTPLQFLQDVVALPVTVVRYVVPSPKVLGKLRRFQTI